MDNPRIFIETWPAKYLVNSAGTVVGLSYRQIETIGIVLGAFDARS
jgi:hypothetical protein